MNWRHCIAFSFVLLVLVPRLAAPSEISFDQSYQIEQAYNLAHGFGLTNLVMDPITLATSYSTESSGWWAPLFPILVAFLLKVGASLAIALKIFYGSLTVLGFAGYLLVYRRFVASLVNVPTPIFLGLFLGFASMTPEWGYSHIGHWATMPYLLLVAFGVREERGWRYAAAAGAISAVNYGFRAQGLVYSAIAAVLFFFAPALTSWRSKFKLIAICSAVFVVLVTPIQIFYAEVGSQSRALHLTDTAYLAESYRFFVEKLPDEVFFAYQRALNFEMYKTYIQPISDSWGIGGIAMPLYRSFVLAMLGFGALLLFKRDRRPTEQLLNVLNLTIWISLAFLIVSTTAFRILNQIQILYMAPTRYLFFFMLVVLCLDHDFGKMDSRRWRGLLMRGFRVLAIVLLALHLANFPQWVKPGISWRFAAATETSVDWAKKYDLPTILAKYPDAILLYKRGGNGRLATGLPLYQLEPEDVSKLVLPEGRTVLYVDPAPFSVRPLKEARIELIEVAPLVYSLKKLPPT